MHSIRTPHRLTLSLAIFAALGMSGCSSPTPTPPAEGGASSIDAPDAPVLSDDGESVPPGPLGIDVEAPSGYPPPKDFWDAETESAAYPGPEDEADDAATGEEGTGEGDASGDDASDEAADEGGDG